ncbi:hypothetical protein [Georgenia sp. SUBG003]|uniref:hypothetical protein n=1 Tax=Georgenia sp. SUBG003 TaxID=1497974 RepID=UPI003AB8F3AC
MAAGLGDVRRAFAITAAACCHEAGGGDHGQDHQDHHQRQNRYAITAELALED